jgi:hypothetical protein
MTGTIATMTTRCEYVSLSVCTYSGAIFTSKKTLNFPQNLENKRPEFFLPRRSMVLKVVRGKILETLELSRRSSATALMRIGLASALGIMAEAGTVDELRKVTNFSRI